jgi:hypothetical protein
VGRRPHLNVELVELVVTIPADLPYGQTLVVVRPGTPGFGGDPGTPEPDRPIPGCAVWPGDTSENTDHADQVTADLTAMIPADTDITATDLVRDPDYPVDSGRVCAVVGSPQRYTNPATGTSVTIIRLRRNTG